MWSDQALAEVSFCNYWVKCGEISICFRWDCCMYLCPWYALKCGAATSFNMLYYTLLWSSESPIVYHPKGVVLMIQVPMRKVYSSRILYCKLQPWITLFCILNIYFLSIKKDWAWLKYDNSSLQQTFTQYKYTYSHIQFLLNDPWWYMEPWIVTIGWWSAYRIMEALDGVQHEPSAESWTD
jgi:hypothetical protein